jgi:hypothetical protein
MNDAYRASRQFERLFLREQNQLSDRAFAIHRQRGPAHVADYHPSVIGACDCFALAANDGRARRGTQPNQAVRKFRI